MKYYEVYVEPLPLPGEHVEKQRRWKFLVELAEGSASEAKAMAAVKKLCGIGPKIDFKMSSMRATPATSGAANLDSANAITGDECRVWVLEEPTAG